MKLKKSELQPKLKLGIDNTMKICWNCLFWNPANGRCPWFEDKTQKQINGQFRYSYFPYNHRCQNSKVFGYMTTENIKLLRNI